MNILALECNNKALANLLYIAKTVLQLIQIIGPFLAIIGMVSVAIKLLSNPENKKLKKGFYNCLMALVLLFSIPLFVNVVMGMLDDSFSLAACWNYAEQAKSSGNSNYIETNDNKNNDKHNILGDPSQYEQGDEKKTGNSNSSSGSGSASSSGSSSSANVSKLIFIGDSRTVGMKAAVNSNDIWSCKSGMGLSWMKSTGVPQIESSITSNAAVIILMGVNDLYEPAAYISYLNGKINEWDSKGATTYFVAVMPTNGSYNSLNSEISSFNNKLKTGLSSKVKWIDANSYLNSTGFNSSDGLHYDNATYQKIYNYIKSNL